MGDSSHHDFLYAYDAAFKGEADDRRRGIAVAGRLLDHTKLGSTARYFEIGIDEAAEVAAKTDVQGGCSCNGHSPAGTGRCDSTSPRAAPVR